MNKGELRHRLWLRQIEEDLESPRSDYSHGSVNLVSSLLRSPLSVSRVTTASPILSKNERISGSSFIEIHSKAEQKPYGSSRRHLSADEIRKKWDFERGITFKPRIGALSRSGGYRRWSAPPMRRRSAGSSEYPFKPCISLESKRIAQLTRIAIPRWKALYDERNVIIYKKQMREIIGTKEHLSNCTFKPEISKVSREISEKIKENFKTENHSFDEFFHRRLADKNKRPSPASNSSGSTFLSFEAPTEPYQFQLPLHSPPPVLPVEAAKGVRAFIERLEEARRLRRERESPTINLHGWTGKQTKFPIGLIDTQNYVQKDKLLPALGENPSKDRKNAMVKSQIKKSIVSMDKERMWLNHLR